MPSAASVSSAWWEWGTQPSLLPALWPGVEAEPREKGFPLFPLPPASLAGQLSCLRKNVPGIQPQDTSPSNYSHQEGQGAILFPKMMGGADGVIHSQAK